MHLRGKRFEYNIIHTTKRADGQPAHEIEPLLRVNYHFPLADELPPGGASVH